MQQSSGLNLVDFATGVMCFAYVGMVPYWLCRDNIDMSAWKAIREVSLLPPQYIISHFNKMQGNPQELPCFFV